MDTFVRRALEAADALSKSSADRGNGDPQWQTDQYMRALRDAVGASLPAGRVELLRSTADGIEARAKGHREADFLLGLVQSIRQNAERVER